MPFTIRPLELGDAAAFRALRIEALSAHSSCFGSSLEEAADRAVGWYEEIASTGLVIGCLDNTGVLAGMAGLELPTEQKARHRATLWGMYVAPRLRGTGAAEALAHATVALARPPVEEVLLTVTLDNVTATRLYERLGFTRYGLDERALKLADGSYVDEVLMRLQL